VLVGYEDGRGRVMGDSSYAADVRPVAGDPAALAQHLQALAAAGCVHAMLVIAPITESSIARAGQALAILDGP